MTMTTTAASGATTVVELIGSPPKPAIAMTNLFDVQVFTANRFILRPRCELAKSLLSMWMHGDMQRIQHSRGPIDEHRYGAACEGLEFVLSVGPQLSSGDDPYFTGMRLTPDEQVAARAFIDERRQKVRDESRPAPAKGNHVRKRSSRRRGAHV